MPNWTSRLQYRREQDVFLRYLERELKNSMIWPRKKNPKILKFFEKFCNFWPQGSSCSVVRAEHELAFVFALGVIRCAIQKKIRN